VEQSDSAEVVIKGQLYFFYSHTVTIWLVYYVTN